jgi:hypothetical protein
MEVCYFISSISDVCAEDIFICGNIFLADRLHPYYTVQNKKYFNIPNWNKTILVCYKKSYTLLRVFILDITNEYFIP